MVNKIKQSPFHLRKQKKMWRMQADWTRSSWFPSWNFRILECCNRFDRLPVSGNDDRRHHFFGQVLLQHRRDSDVRLFAGPSPKRIPTTSLPEERQVVGRHSHLHPGHQLNDESRPMAHTSSDCGRLVLQGFVMLNHGWLFSPNGNPHFFPFRWLVVSFCTESFLFWSIRKWMYTTNIIDRLTGFFILLTCSRIWWCGRFSISRVDDGWLHCRNPNLRFRSFEPLPHSFHSARPADGVGSRRGRHTTFIWSLVFCLC